MPGSNNKRMTRVLVKKAEGRLRLMGELIPLTNNGRLRSCRVLCYLQRKWRLRKGIYGQALKSGAPPPATSLSSLMSSSEPPVTPPNTNSSRQGTASPAEIPPDPLLDSGSFIDAAGMGMETLVSCQANGKGRDTHKKTGETAVSRRSSLTAETSNGSESGIKGSNTKDPDVAARSVSSEKPSWLPSNWVVEDRVRSSGATAGMVDKYYFDPVSGRRFRSRKEVMYFLETGTIRKRKNLENSDSNTMSEAKQPKQSKSDNIAEALATNFDFNKVPEKVDWILTDFSEGSWTPFVGDEKVPEAVKREWSAAFTVLTSKTSTQLRSCTKT